MGQKRRKSSHVLSELSFFNRVCWFRSRTTPSTEQRSEVHRVLRRHTTVLEERRGAIKTNIADSLNVVVQVERRPGRRYISEVLQINGYHPDADLFDYGAVFLAKQDHA